jgi:NAD(P)-dependent dehydrogenase (short-subunit alcohol dehydrogenase family)
MTDRLRGKRVLLTGGVANIGLEILRAFLAEGATVTLVDIDATRGKTLEQEFAPRVQFIQTDLADDAQIRAAVLAAGGWMGGIDTLCLNAGVQISGRIDELPLEKWDLTFTINVRANFILVREALPFLKSAGRSTITLMSSLAGKRGGPGITAYSASKAAVIGMANSFALELAPYGIRVNAVCPGWIDTPFNKPIIDFMGGRSVQDNLVARAVPLGRQAQPAEVAPTFVFLASDESSYITAQAINIDGGAYN